MGRTPFHRIGTAAVVTVVLIGVTSCSSSESPTEGDDAGAILIVPSAIFDGTAFLEGEAVLVEGDSIVSVGSPDDLRKDATEVIDLPGATLLPGFIDLHVHVGVLGDYTALVREGVTTVRDLALPQANLPFPESGEPGLEVVVAGPIVTTPGGYPIPVYGRRIAAAVRGPEDARAMVRELVDVEAGVVKIAVTEGVDNGWPTLSVEEIRAIVSEAHAHDLLVTAHVDTPRDARKALEGGVDEWAHMPACGNGPASLFEQAQSTGLVAIGTLHVYEHCEENVANARRFVAAGGRLLYGSDLGNPSIPFGVDVVELELMLEAGLSLEQVLAAATSLAGEQLGRAPLGSIEKGAPADLFAVAGDVREDLELLEEPTFVMADGSVIVQPTR